MLAAMGDHPDMVKALLAKGADVNVKDNDTGATALIIAVLANDIETAKVLLEGGADINAGDNFGKNPLFYAATDRHNSLQSFCWRKELTST